MNQIDYGPDVPLPGWLTGRKTDMPLKLNVYLDSEGHQHDPFTDAIDRFVASHPGCDVGQVESDIAKQYPELWAFHENVGLLRQYEGQHAEKFTPSERFAYEMLHQQDATQQRREAFSDTPPGDDFTALIDRVLAEQFGGDPSRYADAMLEAGRRRPDLAWQYVERV